MIEEKFSHVKNVPIYMLKVCEYLKGLPKGHLLDIPAGNGYIVKFARSIGFRATGGDFNSAQEDYVNCNMERALPFEDCSFEVVSCLEGIEHVVNQDGLLSELVRITKREGIVIISTPNISNFYSRLKFLFTGTFGQFWPHEMRARTTELVDLGHIHPITPHTLSYLMHARGAELIAIDTDRYKRLVYWPIYMLLWPLMFLGTRRQLGYLNKNNVSYIPRVDYQKILLGQGLMWSRSAILVFKKVI